MMNVELFEICLKAVYAGHKYHLAADAQMDSITNFRPYDPAVGREQQQFDHWFGEWKRYTAQAIALYERDGER